MTLATAHLRAADAAAAPRCRAASFVVRTMTLAPRAMTRARIQRAALEAARAECSATVKRIAVDVPARV